MNRQYSGSKIYFLFNPFFFYHALRVCWSVFRTYGIRHLWKNIQLRFLQMKVQKINPENYARHIFPAGRQLARQRKQYSEMKDKIHFDIFFQADSGPAARKLLDSLQKQSWPEWTLHLINTPLQTESPQIAPQSAGEVTIDSKPGVQMPSPIFQQSAGQISRAVPSSCKVSVSSVQTELPQGSQSILQKLDALGSADSEIQYPSPHRGV